MAEFSQLVRARLQAQQTASEHLDPGILAAFAEQRLDGRERTEALAHLATCAECREVVALASQAAPELQATSLTAKAAPVLHRRLTMWRAGMIGALAVLAVSATVLLRIDRSRPVAMSAELHVAEQTSAPPPSLASADQKQAEKPAPRSAPQIAERKTERRDQQSQAAGGRASGDVAGTLAANAGRSQANGAPADLMASPRQNVARAQTASSLALAPPAAPPPAQSQPALADEYRASNQVAQSQQQQPSAPLQQQEQPGTQTASQAETVEIAGSARSVQENARAKSAQTQSAQMPARTMDAELRRAPAYEGAAAQKPTNLQALNSKLSSTSRWSITADGKLQRATGAGPEGPQWQLVPVDDAAIFRVVNATGRDVWAGGNGGALFHSNDDGEHWTRITPQSGERKLEGDVISIRVANQIVRVRTSAGQNWISSDGGKNWKLEGE